MSWGFLLFLYIAISFSSGVASIVASWIFSHYPPQFNTPLKLLFPIHGVVFVTGNLLLKVLTKRLWGSK